MVIGADFKTHAGERKRGEENMGGRYGVKERNTEGQIIVDFAQRMEMAVVKTFFKKREEHRLN